MQFALSAVCRFVCFSLLLGAAACGKDSADKKADEQKAADEAKIRKYVAGRKLTTAVRTNSGLYYAPLVAGAGATPTAGQLVTLHYRLYTLSDTTQSPLYQSTYTSGVAFSFRVGGGTIAGFDEGVRLMKKGETARLIIPSGLAYGVDGRTDGNNNYTILPNTSLVYDLVLLNIQ